ncbi:GNAT family N-acetyltransferase [Microbacterium sp. bgisy207]|jgi:tRNA (guanine37-N1)-methyltransferase|uniref:GNAT family N-acetyltransferase n=1 Tax=Microbacterium sp. bgisy207 TaxID=3413800 RepID=UPI003EBAE001
MDAVIRRAAPADAAALHVLAAATFPLACPPESTPADQRAFIEAHLSEASFQTYLTDPHRVLLVDERDQQLVGYTMLVLGEPTDADVRAALDDDAARPAAELSKCYALPATHGTGVAAGLLEETVAEARRRGAGRVWLGVNQQNARAQRFYAKHGFSVVGEKRFRVGRRLESDYVLVRDVPGIHSQE